MKKTTTRERIAYKWNAKPHLRQSMMVITLCTSNKMPVCILHTAKYKTLEWHRLNNSTSLEFNFPENVFCSFDLVKTAFFWTNGWKINCRNLRYLKSLELRAKKSKCFQKLGASRTNSNSKTHIVCLKKMITKTLGLEISVECIFLYILSESMRLLARFANDYTTIQPIHAPNFNISSAFQAECAFFSLVLFCMFNESNWIHFYGSSGRTMEMKFSVWKLYVIANCTVT